MLYPYLFVNGEICPKDEAVIPVWDLGLLRGLGIFDFFKVEDGIPVFVEDHIDRLTHSLEIMDFQTGVSRDQWLRWFYEMIRLNEAERCGFRVVVTGGFSEDGYSIPEQKNMYLMLHHLYPNDPVQYSEGVRLLSSSYQRDMPAAKTTIYLQSMQYQPRLLQAGAFEVLYHWKGLISECSRCNIFFIDQDGAMHTPGTGILKGITRRQVIAIASEQHLSLQERDVYMEEIPQMAGAFLTATTKGVLPVVKIDDQVIGDGRVHPLARQLQSWYLQRTEAYLVQARVLHKNIV